ncbi:hypothetical protein LCGC14_1431950, partial [marine sediment metagenome]
MDPTARQYNPVTLEIATELKTIVGDRYVVFGDPEKLAPYAHDEVAEEHYAHSAEALVRPESAEEIAAILKLANPELEVTVISGDGDLFAIGGN